MTIYILVAVQQKGSDTHILRNQLDLKEIGHSVGDFLRLESVLFVPLTILTSLALLLVCKLRFRI